MKKSFEKDNYQNFKILSLYLFLLLSSLSVYSQNNKAYGLMTDLIEHTDRTWNNGYVTNIGVSDMCNSISPMQCAYIRSNNPMLSWIVPNMGNGTYQTSYHVILSDNINDVSALKGNIWDSGEQHNSKSIAIRIECNSLKPKTTYYWRVKVNTNKDEKTEWSDIKSFRTADKLSKNAVSYYPLEKTTSNPILINKSDRNVYFIDFGKDAYGQLSLTLKSNQTNDTITVHLGEALKNGKIMRDVGKLSVRYQSYKLALIKGINTYKLDIRKDKRNTGPAAVKMPNYIGEVLPFRYCEIEGYKHSLSKTDVLKECVHYPFDYNESYFESSDETLNSVWNLCKYSMYATSFAGLFVDGDRERIPYEADALINQLGYYCTDREYSLSRRTCEYLLAHPTWPTEWIMQALSIAWNDYMYTGDKNLLEQNYEVLKARTLISLREKNGLISSVTGLQNDDLKKSIHFNDNIRDIVDWPSSKPGMDGVENGESDGFVFTKFNAVVNAWHCLALKQLSEISGVLGKDNDMKYYGDEYNLFRKRFLNFFFDKKRALFTDGLSREETHASLHSNMFPIAFEIITGKTDKIYDFIKNKGMACSVYGSQFLLDALYNIGASKDALSLLTAKNSRGWYNMIQSGSTITMEAWDNKYKPNQDWNHAWGASPANIIPRRLVGITPLKPGFEIVSIKPQIADIKWIKSNIPTIRGNVSVEVHNENDIYSLSVGIPANMQAKIYIPMDKAKSEIRCNGKELKTSPSKDRKFNYLGLFQSGNYEITMKSK